MICLKRFSFALAFCFAASISLWGQTAPVVYVATGDSNVYSVTPSGVATQLIPASNTSYSGAQFTSLTVGPDNTAENTNGNTYFFLYACDTGNNNIVRLRLSTNSPGTVSGAVATIYDGGGSLTAPVCGRVASNGDLYVSSANSGSGVYVLPDASTATGGFPLSATQVYNIGGSFTGGGIAQKNSGDLLVVDQADNSILRANFAGANSSSTAAPFAPVLSPYVAGLSSPNGIARISTGQFFVANQGAQNVLEYDPATGNPPSPTTCGVSIPHGNVTLSSIATSEDNYVYVGVASTSTNKRVVEVFDGTAPKCGSNSTAIPLDAVDAETVAAVAVPPVRQSPIPALSGSGTDTTGVTTSIFNFGSSAFQTLTTNPTNPTDCTPSATQAQVPLSYLQTLLNGGNFISTFSGSTWPGGTPVPYNGEGGFGTLYTAKAPSGCNLASNTLNNLLIAAITDSTQFTNPRIVQCDAGSPCQILDSTGTWPSGYIPDDVVGGATGRAFSQYFLANAALSGELGSFCGFQTPVIETTDSTTAPIVTGNNLSVKFKLAAQGGTCSNGPYVTDAVALISVAQVSSKVDGPVTMFSTVAIATQGSSTDNPPLFKYNTNSTNYQFSLNLKGLPKGTYALSVTFLSNNAPYQYTYFAIQ
jgi:hypothetical protein